ncbi:MAG TPA: hypothetical protein VMW07_06695 [Gallionella sp.]|nr:hypothetical protein [Gallionella sp.]
MSTKPRPTYTDMKTTTDLEPATERAAHAFFANAARYDFAGAILFGSRAHHTNPPDSDTNIT